MKHPAKTIILSATLLLSSACSTQPTQLEQFIAAPDSDAVAQLLHQEALFNRQPAPLNTPDQHILAVTAEMRYFVNEHVPPVLTPRARLRYLVDAMVRPQQLGIRYQPGITQSAADTFDDPQGDCLSLSLLFIALAREAKLDVYFNEVSVPPSWEMLSNSSSAIYKHINAVVDLGNGQREVIDFSVDIYDYRYPQKRVSDDIAAAQYYSNLGVGALNSKNYGDAYLYLRRALYLGPDEAYIWGNLGVLFRREGHNGEAELAFLKALSLDSEESASLSNLARLYRSSGRKDRAKQLEQVIESRQRDNPFWHYSRSRAAFEKGDYPQALNSIKRAIRLDKNEYRFYQFAAVIFRSQGNTDKYHEYGLKAAHAKLKQDK